MTSKRSQAGPIVKKTSANESADSKQTFFTDPHFRAVFARTVIQVDPESDLFMNIAQRAYQEHEKSLIPCSKCGRTFFPDRVQIHENSCNGSKKINGNLKPTKDKLVQTVNNRK